MTDYSEFKCSFIPQEDIRRIADEFRSQYWPGNVSPINVERIIENELMIDIIPEYGIRQFAKIDAYLRSDFSGIVVDIDQYVDQRGRYENRLRFSFAHEIGHFVLHRYIYDRLKFDSPREYAEYVLNMPESARIVLL